MVGARILVVEDDDILSNLISQNLRARQHEVHIARDAHDALLSLRSSPFDLILLDINLPDETGWDVLRDAQRAGCLHPTTLNTGQQVLPVVVLSAVHVGLHRLDEFKPLCYLPKPFPMESLLRLASEAAQRRATTPITDGDTATRPLQTDTEE
jgi:DNA-binding response OmpR family regulator